jgi:hypothetical protein
VFTRTLGSRRASDQSVSTLSADRLLDQDLELVACRRPMRDELGASRPSASGPPTALHNRTAGSSRAWEASRSIAAGAANSRCTGLLRLCKAAVASVAALVAQAHIAVEAGQMRPHTSRDTRRTCDHLGPTAVEDRRASNFPTPTCLRTCRARCPFPAMEEAARATASVPAGLAGGACPTTQQHCTKGAK